MYVEDIDSKCKAFRSCHDRELWGTHVAGNFLDDNNGMCVCGGQLILPARGGPRGTREECFLPSHRLPCP